MLWGQTKVSGVRDQHGVKREMLGVKRKTSVQKKKEKCFGFKTGGHILLVTMTRILL